ncbi:MAG TPA: CoA-transferase [Geminicoccus sp.]|uniref:acyl CoA:acetate/3-ketoacid CoA transferase n=1 Tax=Geminicoccus sp. TaxID=2024832 RepID=UPI002C35D91A|nr:CoA-transferase [Geminicoccus sp.]HWL67736.1 CoA-transferase [Geminicoccus sp.]
MDKRIDADAVAATIEDGATILLASNGGGMLEADFVYAAIEQRFLTTGHPRDLTLVHALGIGDGKERGLNRFAHEGMVARVIGGHWSWSPRMQALAEAELIEAFVLPAGCIALRNREVGAGRPGLITHVGLGTFADPRLGGGAANERARRSGTRLVELIEIGGEEKLRYLPFRADLAIVGGSVADPAGNVSFVHEAADLDALAAVTAAHAGGGRVIVQVGELVPRHALPARQVALPGILVDHVVHCPDQQQSYIGKFDPAMSGEVPRPDGEPPLDEPVEFGPRLIIARRAAEEIRAGASVNFGYGIPGAIPGVLRQKGLMQTLWVTVEQGIHNGDLYDGFMFGAARYPEAIVSSTRQFDFYSGGGIDVGFLGMGEMDRDGNVNVSRLGSRIVGPGGFVDISQNAKEVVFCGTFDAKGTSYRHEPGRLVLEAPGQVRKLVEQVREVTFSGHYGRVRGQEVLYVTERAVFRLAPDAIELVEVAPGIDPKADVIEQMGFVPQVANPLRTMPPALFS